MDKLLSDYLHEIEKHLRPIPSSERIDIIQEIKSEIMELQKENIDTEQILARLGNPKELAKAYLSELISNSNKFSLRKLSAVVAFYSLAGFSGIFVLPITSISGVTFLTCSVLCPIAGIIKFAAHFLGYEIEEIQFVIGSFSADAVTLLPISILMGAIFLAIGMLLWRLTVILVKSMSKVKTEIMGD